MTLDDACSEFESLFGAIRVDAEFAGAGTIVCTGALGRPETPPPVLCATRDLAIALWLRCAREYALETCGFASLVKARTLVWVQEPQLLTFKMTIQDQMGGQRVATPRFAVYSVLAINEQPQHVAPECLNLQTAESATPADPEAKTAPAPKRARRRTKV